MNQNIVENAKIIWEYHKLHQNLKHCDGIMVFCSNDIRVAQYAATLYHQGYGKFILFSGGIAHENDILSTGWDKPEAEVFADIAMQNKIPKEKILLENKANNTGENIHFSKQFGASLPNLGFFFKFS